MNSPPTAARLDALPPYLFVEIDRLKKRAIEAGRDVIDLGVGDPDRPTFDFVIERMNAAMRDPRNHRYPSGIGLPEYRETIAAWFERRFGVSLDAATQVLSLIGSKEGLGHVPLALMNPGRVALVPRPGYPVYHSATVFAGGEPYIMPLIESRGWLPDLNAIPADVLSRTSLMFLNYPNNPIGATASLDFFAAAVKLARTHGFWLVHDAAYSEMWYERPPPSILQVEGAVDVCIEMHSLSKTFNMTGWRLGFAVGNATALAALAKVKNNVDSGAFNAVQLAGVEAIRRIDGPEVAAMRATYRARRDAFVAGLRRSGFRVEMPPATFYVWAACPGGIDSMQCARRMLEEQAVVAIPGAGFGPEGDGFVRFSLTTELNRLEQCVERLEKLRW